MMLLLATAADWPRIGLMSSTLVPATAAPVAAWVRDILDCPSSRPPATLQDN